MGSLILYDNLHDLLCQFTVEMQLFANFNFLQSSSHFFTAYWINLHALSGLSLRAGLGISPWKLWVSSLAPLTEKQVID